MVECASSYSNQNIRRLELWVGSFFKLKLLVSTEFMKSDRLQIGFTLRSENDGFKFTRGAINSLPLTTPLNPKQKSRSANHVYGLD